MPDSGRLVSRGAHCYPLGVSARALLYISLETQQRPCRTTEVTSCSRAMRAGIYLQAVALVSLETTGHRNRDIEAGSDHGHALSLCPSARAALFPEGAKDMLFVA